MKTINIGETEKFEDLKAGDSILISGVIYTARDAAHKRMKEDFESGKGFPFDIKGQAVYYAGPCPAKPQEVIGSCGPTTAGRMDAYAPLLLDNGLKVMIGKGGRNKEVVDAIVRNKAVYLGVAGGLGALIASCIKSAEVIAYPDLETEAIRKLRVENLPCTVLVDCKGTDFYEEARKPYKKA